MKRTTSLLIVLLLAPLSVLDAADMPVQRPNIIVIYSDDHGFADLGAQGVDKDIRTPNLDALAKDGVRFVRGSVSAPQCVPSRAGVITGRYQQRFGVEDNGKGPLPLAELTIAERLKAAGYVSCQVGKWHLEPPPKRGNTKEKTPDSGKGALAFLPLGQGFDEYFTGPMNTFVASHDLKGNDKNTLIFFIGDNGAPLKENAWDGSLKLPLVGEKGMLTDGGIRTPFVAAWPGTFPAGTTYENPVINLDVAATAVAIAGLPHDEKLDGVNLVPFVLGQKTGNPHDALYWRWRSQAAIRADHWKYIRVGPEERYLFDLNAPEGESELAKNNLLGKFPEVAADLEERLMEWNATLPPPGLPREPNAQDEMFYDAHVKVTGVKSIKEMNPAKDKSNGPRAHPGNGNNWVVRNATASIKDSALQVVPDPDGRLRPFIAFSGFAVSGPAVATASVRTDLGGKLGIAWRLEGQNDFSPGQVIFQDLKGSAEFRDVALNLPAKGPIIHIRLMLPDGTCDLRRLEIKPSNGDRAKLWTFAK